MAEKKIKEIIDYILQCLASTGLRVSKIVLFGSRARGNAGWQSDLDILIVSGDFRGKDIFQRAELTKDAEILAIRRFLVPLDIITLTPEEYRSGKSPIVEHARKGKVFYAA